jgi:hypothetical protein
MTNSKTDDTGKRVPLVPFPGSSLSSGWKLMALGGAAA